ncbi:transposase [bacterium]|nr:transposase [bacterium]
MKYRKNIRLKYYDYKNNGFYFVTICSSKRVSYFNRYEEIIASRLNKIPMEFPGVDIDYVKVMPDHLHIVFVLENSAKALPQVIQRFKSSTTQLVRRNGFSGKCFW